MNLSTGRWSTATVYAVTNFTADRATPAELADWPRGHWTIEVLHHVRDVTFAEDASQIGTGKCPTVDGHHPQRRDQRAPRARTTTNARTHRAKARDPRRPLRLLGLLA